MQRQIKTRLFLCSVEKEQSFSKVIHNDNAHANAYSNANSKANSKANDNA